MQRLATLHDGSTLNTYNWYRQRQYSFRHKYNPSVNGGNGIATRQNGNQIIADIEAGALSDTNPLGTLDVMAITWLDR